MSTIRVWVQKKVNGNIEGNEIHIEVNGSGTVYDLIAQASSSLTKDTPIADMSLMVDDRIYTNRTPLSQIEQLKDNECTVFICWNDKKQQVKTGIKTTTLYAFFMHIFILKVI